MIQVRQGFELDLTFNVKPNASMDTESTVFEDQTITWNVKMVIICIRVINPSLCIRKPSPASCRS